MKQNIIFTSSFLLFFLLTCASLIAQNPDADTSKTEKYFDGFHLGISMGVQNIFGGAFIDNLDVLGQKSGFVTEFSAGYRKQLVNDRLLIGAELQFGITDGNLEQIDTRNQMEIDYKNNSQFGYGVNIGIALGRKKKILLYTYGNVTKRNFDITITETNGTNFTQEDGQGFNRYGLGLEIPVLGNFNVKAIVGRVNVDFGDLETNIDVDDKTDFSLGVVYQF
nr:outer membrane beta-barrel protein [uncultured Allomuricauda sp.]